MDGELEIDIDRGVIYFHSKTSGITVLRICKVPEYKLEDLNFIDITIGHTTPRTYYKRFKSE